MPCCLFIVLEIDYLPVLNKSPLQPALQTVKHAPMTLEHWFTLLQLPHFSLHSLPYDPLPPYETITDTTNARQKFGTGPYCVKSRIATQQHCLVCITIINIDIFR